MITIKVFKEGEYFVAQCLEHDVNAQAKNLDMAIYNLSDVIYCHIQNGDWENIPPAPQYYWEMK